MDKKKTKIIVIVAAVCVVIAIAVGIAFAVRGSKEPEITVPANSMGADTPAPSESVGEVSTDEPSSSEESTEPTVPEGTTAEAKPTATKPHATAPTKKPTTTKVAPTKATGPVTNGENPFVEFDENGNPVPIGATDFRRSLGYCELYDNMAPYAAMDFDTVRIKFRYDNLDWMVQMWKGQYGPSIGCEIGVYHKPTMRMVEFYDCATDENSLVMEASLYRKGKFVFRMPRRLYWWAAAFDPGMLDNVSDRSELNVVARITLKDKEMCNAFANSLQKQKDAQGRTFQNVGSSYNKNQPTVTPVFQVVGNDVYFTW